MTANSPVRVFISYSHRDESYREQLKAHLALLRRQGLLAEWHDRVITGGQEWAGEIDRNLREADLILLLVSADFLASDYCYDKEMALALERHAAGEAIVVPIVLRSVDWHDAPFGKLQALPKDSKPVATWSDRDEAWTDVARGLRHTVAAAQELRCKAQERSTATATGGGTPARRPLIVDAMHRGDFPTISAAIKAARPGDEIRVRRGYYPEGLVIDKPLEIIGDDPLGAVVVETQGQYTLLFKTTNGRVANLTLRQTGGGKWYCVNVAQGRLILESCDITCQSLACVAIHDGADPIMRGNRIHGSKDSGVYIYQGGRGTLEDNDIFAHGLPGVAIRGNGSDATLRRNTIRDGKSAGVRIYEGGQGTLEDNDISANALAGVLIEDASSNATLRRNKIHEGKASGVRFEEGGQGTLEDNDISANAFAGVQIGSEGSNPTLRRNKIHEGKSAGVLIFRGGRGMLEDNDISANALAGVQIRGQGSDTALRRNTIYDNKQSGVYVNEGGRGTLEDNDISANARAGVEVEGAGSVAVLRHNRINRNSFEAIWVTKGGGGTFEDNDLRENTRGAWDIADGDKAAIRQSRNLE